MTLTISTRPNFEKYLNWPAEFQKQWNISIRQLKPRPFWPNINPGQYFLKFGLVLIVRVKKLVKSIFSMEMGSKAQDKHTIRFYEKNTQNAFSKKSNKNFLSATLSQNPSNKIHLTRIIHLRIYLRNFNYIKFCLGANVHLRGSLLPIHWQRFLWYFNDLRVGCNEICNLGNKDLPNIHILLYVLLYILWYNTIYI